MDFGNSFPRPYFLKRLSILGVECFKPFSFRPENHFRIIIGVKRRKSDVKLVVRRERKIKLFGIGGGNIIVHTQYDFVITEYAFTARKRYPTHWIWIIL
mgnify:CR=1 FL=1